MSGLIRGITLTHPWAWCIAHAGKDVENRTWHPSRQGGKLGMFLAIHGGAVPGPRSSKRMDQRRDLAYAASLMGMRQSHPAVLRAWAAGVHAEDEEKYFLPGIVAVAQLAAVTRDSTSKWAARDQYHWLLAEVVTLAEPVAHRGAQGLWEIEPFALEQIPSTVPAGKARMTGRKYRWLTEGERYVYQAALGKGDDARRGTRCIVITVPKPSARPGNALVQFEDGQTAIVPAGVLKAAS